MNAVVVFDPVGAATRAAETFRRDLVGALEGVMDEVVVSSSQDFSHARHALRPGSLLIVEATALPALPPGRLVDGVRAWVLVFPAGDRRAPGAARWIDPARSAGAFFELPRYIVPSEEAKDQLEAALSDQRIEVLVLPRAVASLSSPGAGWVTTDGRTANGEPDVIERWAKTWAESGPSAGARASDERAFEWVEPEFSSALDSLAVQQPVDLADVDVAVLGANLNFIGQLSDRLARGHVRSLRRQEWKYLSAPTDADGAQELIDTSDTIVAEWIRPSAAWIQDHAPFDKRLIVRGHRYEVTTEFPNLVDMERYFAAVVITPWVGRELVRKFHWPAEKIVYIPNYVDSNYFRRPKLPGAQFTLGVVGIRPSLKRIDLALSLLRRLREIDPRYNLRVRSASPFDHINWASDAAVRDQWAETLLRVKHDPLLRGAVFFDDPGQDMSSWFRQIGVVLSLSDIEGSHVALAEGVASGALGVARRWPGIRGLWPEHLVHDSVDTAVQAILAVRHEGVLAEVVAGDQDLPSLDSERVLGAWKDLLAGDIDSAQSAFGVLDHSVGLHDPHTHT